MSPALDLLFLAFVVACGLAAIHLRDLVAAAFLLGAYSFFMCLVWAEMGAVDVALTEAAVGAGISTALFIAAIYRTGRWARGAGDRSWRTRREKLVAALVALAMGALLVFGSFDFPSWGDPESPANRGGSASDYYIEHTLEDTSVPNLVTAVLADYRGYDTMYETTVIFCAGIAVAMLLRRRPKRHRHPEDDG
jgi:multicomponent Na+:H+ antiporter subunit B